MASDQRTPRPGVGGPQAAGQPQAPRVRRRDLIVLPDPPAPRPAPRAPPVPVEDRPTSAVIILLLGTISLVLAIVAAWAAFNVAPRLPDVPQAASARPANT